MSLCVLNTVFPLNALAAKGYTVGECVWNEDFQTAAVGNYTAASPIGFYNDGTGTQSAEITEDASGNKYLHVTQDSDGSAGCTHYMYIEVPDEAKDAANGNVFTFEVDIKLDPYSEIAGSEYNIGMHDEHMSWGADGYAYFTMTGAGPDEYPYVAVNGGSYGRYPESVTMHKFPTDTTASDETRLLRPHSWNTYRFVIRKAEVTAGSDNVYDNAASVYYTDVYLNGWFFYRVGHRYADGSELDRFAIGINLNEGRTHGGFSLDNAKAYYGVAEEDGAENATGKFIVDTYDFNDLPAQTYEIAEGESYGLPVLQGENADHNMGALRRYNTWGMNLDISKGVCGKSADDASLGVSGKGRLNFSRQVGESVFSSKFSTAYGTALSEGETLEIASDVMFKSTDESLAFQAVTNCDGGNDRVAIEITPNYYSHGHWQDLDDFQNHRTEIIPGLPLGKWIRLKLAVTRGAANGLNKYSIYADNIAIVENAKLEYWYTDESFIQASETEWVYEKSQHPETLKGDALKAGFMSMFFNGNASYDNITFTRYLGGAEYSVNTQVPEILAQNNPEGTMTSIRGKVYVGTSTIDEILTQFGVNEDDAVEKYIVRDANGNTVSDYSKSAGGNYIDILTTGGEHLYVTLAANNYQQNITEVNNQSFGDFTLGSVKAEDTEAGYGRLAEDRSIKLTNSTSEKKYVKYTTDSYENNVVEFSFLPDAETNFGCGYDLSLIAMQDTGDRAYARRNNTGMQRSYPEIITMSDGTITGTRNGETVKIGNYTIGEWTKIKLVFNHGVNNSVLVSVNDGAATEIYNGPLSYFYKLESVYLTLPANKSVTVDDVRIFEGAKKDTAAPAVISIDDRDIVLRRNSIIISDNLKGGGAMDTLSSTVKLSSEEAETRYIDKDGIIVSDSQNEASIDKYVVVMNDIYTYYDVYFGDIEAISIDENSIAVKLVGSSVADTENAKLIVAVYDSDLRMKTCSIIDLEFSEDENGVPYATVTDYAEPDLSEGDIVKYFVWDMDKMIPLCDSK